jgi:hypothetical protein
MKSSRSLIVELLAAEGAVSEFESDPLLAFISSGIFDAFVEPSASIELFAKRSNASSITLSSGTVLGDFSPVEEMAG